MGGLCTLGAYRLLRGRGLSDGELGITRLTRVAEECIGDGTIPIHVSFDVCLGVRG